MELYYSSDIKHFIEENNLTNIVIETGDKNIFIPEESKFIVTKDFLTDKTHIFAHCITLKKIDMSNFDFSEITTMEGWFLSCEYLTEIIFPQVAYCEKLGNLSGCFGNTKIETIDLSFMQFVNRSQITNIENAFYFAEAKKIILPKLTVENLEYLFFNCNNLEEIKLQVSIDEFNELTLRKTFDGCENLKVVDFSGSKFNSFELAERLDEEITEGEENTADFLENCSVILPYGN